MKTGIGGLKPTLVFDPLIETVLKQVAPNNAVDANEKPDRDPPLSDRASGIQCRSHSIAEKSNVGDIPTSISDLSSMEPISDTATTTKVTDHLRELVMGDIALSDSTSGAIQIVSEKGSCRSDAHVGNCPLSEMALKPVVPNSNAQTSEEHSENRDRTYDATGKVDTGTKPHGITSQQ